MKESTPTFSTAPSQDWSGISVSADRAWESAGTGRSLGAVRTAIRVKPSSSDGVAGVLPGTISLMLSQTGLTI